MKKFLPLLLIAALAFTAYWFREKWLPAAAHEGAMLGYIEAETMFASSPVGGKLTRVEARPGQLIERDAPLFAVDDAVPRADLARAEAAVATAAATLADLETGKRPEEIRQIEAQLAEARAEAWNAEAEFNRVAKTASTGATSYSQFDRARTNMNTTTARLRQLEAALEVAKLPARAKSIEASRANLQQAKAAAEAARLHVADYTQSASAEAVVDDVFFAAGETVTAGQPVMQLHKPGDYKIVFFVPEAQVARAQPNSIVRFTCDGCEEGLAVITRIESRPEYTPPVIYSQQARQKLVFRVEARPRASSELAAGIPVEVVFAK